MNSALPRLAGTLVATLLAVAMAHAQERNYGDWRYDCPQGQNCRIYQSLAERGAERAFVTMEVVRRNQGGAYASITLPLGIYLPTGIAVRVDQGLTRELPVTVCLPGGCKVLLPLDDELLDAMERGERLRLRFYQASDDPLEVTLSLRGFTAGHAALGPEPRG
ncbi:MAG: invasion associated locus B family protein [Gammaproteobacteria bacterium]|nr:invasion associated locus B family protein [Gammaproteobacteria bacterium]